MLQPIGGKVAIVFWEAAREEMAGEAIPNASQPCPDPNHPPLVKKKRNLPGTPDPEAEVIALSPRTLLATNRFLCEICGKGFQRDQNLQLHRRGHNLPWKLKQRSGTEPRKRVYVCPEPSCIHHNPARALGDLTGIKKHFCRKHGEKKWKCSKCSKRYAVQSDWKAHSKTCGTREYRCDCGIIFSRRDSFITHRAFCDALAEEAARVSAAYNMTSTTSIRNADHLLEDGLRSSMLQHLSPSFKPNMINNGEVDQQARQGLSLWMGQGGQIGSPLSNDTSITNLYGDLFGSCSSWVNGRELTSSSSLPNASMVKVTERPQQPLLGSVPSLFTSLHQRSAPAVSDMSATAMLQKAAQAGVTSTTRFMGSFEPSKCQNTSSTSDGSKFDALFIQNYHRSNLETGDVCITRSSNMIKDYLGGETRDFLGVGVQALCQPSVNGWI